MINRSGSVITAVIRLKQMEDTTVAFEDSGSESSGRSTSCGLASLLGPLVYFTGQFLGSRYIPTIFSGRLCDLLTLLHLFPLFVTIVVAAYVLNRKLIAFASIGVGLLAYMMLPVRMRVGKEAIHEQVAVSNHAPLVAAVLVTFFAIGLVERLQKPESRNFSIAHLLILVTIVAVTVATWPTAG